jgi:YVTN family beta-propeller protein
MKTPKETIVFAVTLVAFWAARGDAEPFAYVPNSGDGTVSVIDTATDTVAAIVGVGRSPFGVAIDPSGRSVYISNQGDASISRIDTRTNTATTIASIAGYGLAVSADGQFLYIAEFAQVSVLSTATSAVVRTISVAGLGGAFRANEPNAIVLGGGERLFRVTTSDDEACFAQILGCHLVLLIADPTTGGAAGNPQTGVGAAVQAIALDPSGGLLYTVYRTDTHDLGDTDVVNGTIVGEPHGGITSQPLQDGGFGVAVDPTGERIFATEGRNRAPTPGALVIIDAQANRITDHIPVGASPGGVALNAAGTRAYVVNTGDNTVSVLNTESKTVVDTIRVGGAPIALGQFVGPGVAVATPTVTPSATPTSSRPVTPMHSDGGGCAISDNEIPSPSIVFSGMFLLFVIRRLSTARRASRAETSDGCRAF